MLGIFTSIELMKKRIQGHLNMVLGIGVNTDKFEFRIISEVETGKFYPQYKYLSTWRRFLGWRYFVCVGYDSVFECFQYQCRAEEFIIENRQNVHLFQGRITKKVVKTFENSHINNVIKEHLTNPDQE